jgi:hypothetical protein
VPTWGEGGSVCAISGLGREEDGGIGAEDLADPEIRVEELTASQIQAIVGGTGTVCGGVRQHRVRGGILEREERIWKVIEGVRDTRRQCAGQRQCGCDNGREMERYRRPGHRGVPTTCALEASRGRPRVDRGGGWGGRKNPRESRGARARQTGTDLRQSGAWC